jgi:hypothetical protein
MVNNIENKKIIRWGILGCVDVTEVKSGPADQKTASFKITLARKCFPCTQTQAKKHKS